MFSLVARKHQLLIPVSGGTWSQTEELLDVYGQFYPKPSKREEKQRWTERVENLQVLQDSVCETASERFLLPGWRFSVQTPAQT